MEPQEFKEMVDNIRKIEKALGRVTYDLTDKQKAEREHTRSLFVAKNMKAGDVFTPENLRSVRPGNGLHTKYYEELLGKKISKDARLGTPMSWELVDFTGEDNALDQS
jgi:sialic acid synthase SpsE